jgi:hypothetical protein
MGHVKERLVPANFVDILSHFAMGKEKSHIFPIYIFIRINEMGVCT